MPRLFCPDAHEPLEVSNPYYELHRLIETDRGGLLIERTRDPSGAYTSCRRCGALFPLPAVPRPNTKAL